jgi:two-component system LytT family response regulator
MNKVRTILVEDEEKGMENIVFKINKHCPQIEIVAKCYSGESALLEIERLNPDLVFMDVRLGSLTGFDILNRLSHIPFEIIFSTGYSQYAIDAFKVNAIDYLLKPIKPIELILAVEKVCLSLKNRGPIKRIPVPIKSGFQFIAIDEIIYCLADDSYTRIYRTKNKSMVLVTKTLKNIGMKLPIDNFLKISRSAIINLDLVENFRRSNGGLVTMINDTELSVSKDRRSELLRRITT